MFDFRSCREVGLGKRGRLREVEGGTALLILGRSSSRGPFCQCFWGSLSGTGGYNLVALVLEEPKQPRWSPGDWFPGQPGMFPTRMLSHGDPRQRLPSLGELTDAPQLRPRFVPKAFGPLGPAHGSHSAFYVFSTLVLLTLDPVDGPSHSELLRKAHFRALPSHLVQRAKRGSFQSKLTCLACFGSSLMPVDTHVMHLRRPAIKVLKHRPASLSIAL